ncbi:extracellular solute-binding protein [Paenactinomyces guangxiensis]|uniref:Extracellular solute-binding protein n=1 Tax=Paenactinomyces guangxiensis TaxID=1490290 RepID=A0A7W1WP62_9BACL|nr:extracellular solute-binding protein [Paenactinomyces guangxiensis]MBA4493480.1 extracellular solute-binding protein [Paenactinomyces guangxiensis]MBH8590571.1 extracellular solute-binding protein [Paenactinomyces guangxiensis]
MAKISKKLALFVAMVTLIGSLLTACSSDQSTSSSSSIPKGAAMDDYGVGKQFKATKPISFTTMYNDAAWYAYKKDWLLWKEITKRTNVTLKPTVVPMSDYNQKRSLLISSGDAPLIIPKTYPGQETPFVASGAILPISDYVKYMPNFMDKVKKWNLEPELDTLRQADGKYYILPGLHENVWPDYTLAVRTDIFQKHHIPIPKTWDEFEAALRKLKEIYPDITPFSERWSTGNSTTPLGALLGYAAPTFGTVGGWGTTNYITFDQKQNKFVFAGATQEYKDMLTYFNRLVKDGLMDKESLSQSDDTAVQKFVNGKSFVISTNSQEIEVMRNSMKKTLGEGNFSISKIDVPGGPKGHVIAGSRLENGIMINAKAKDDPNFLALLQFIDWLWYSDEGQEFTKWGVEGTTYKKENGKRVLMPDINFLGLNPAGKKDLRKDFGFGTGTFSYGGTTELLRSTMNPEEIKFQESMLKNKKVLPVNPPYPMSAVDQEQANLLSTPLTDMVKQNTAKFILGSRPLSDWDKYVSELKAKGMDRYVGLVNKAYEDFKKKK